jgi:hypothetical protein
MSIPATTPSTTGTSPAIPRDLETAFWHYYRKRLQEAGAITPGQKHAVLDDMERELYTEGRVPIVSGVVKQDVNSPAVRAALEGREVVLGGTAVTAAPRTGHGRQAPRLLALAGILIGMCALGWWLVVGRTSEAASAVAIPTPSVTASVALTPGVTPTGDGLPTATPYALALTTGSAARSESDPASLELAGFSYVLGVGTVNNGEWLPQAAEWLEASTLHRVIAVPWEPNLVNAIATLNPETLITLRLRSGELVSYRLEAVMRVQRQQIEVLTGRRPGLSIVLYGEPSDQRTVITARALQSAQDLNTDGLTVTVATTPTVATPVPSAQTIPVTDTLHLTHAVAGITLSVHTCGRMSEVQGQPAANGEVYLVCEVELRNVGSTLSRFSDQAFGITERAWWELRPEHMPSVNVGVTDALGAGTVAPGSGTRGRLVGVVTRAGGMRQSTPVLVWFQDGIRYVISLPY